MWSMTKKAVLFAAGLVMLAGGTASAAPVDVKVPFPFIVQGKTMPAGQYRVESDSDDPSVWLIEGEKGTHAGTFVLTRVASGHDPAGDEPALTFDKNEDQYQLVGIWESRAHGQEVTSTKHVSTHAVPTHATKGVVKSVDASTLVITREGQDGWGYDIRAESRHTPSGNGRRGRVSRRPLSRGWKDLRGDRHHRSAIEATASSHCGTQAVSVSKASRRRSPCVFGLPDFVFIAFAGPRK